MAGDTFFISGVKSLNPEVKEEIARILEKFKADSEMSESSHPDNVSFENGIFWLCLFLREI